VDHCGPDALFSLKRGKKEREEVRKTLPRGSLWHLAFGGGEKKKKKRGRGERKQGEILLAAHWFCAPAIQVRVVRLFSKKRKRKRKIESKSDLNIQLGPQERGGGRGDRWQATCEGKFGKGERKMEESRDARTSNAPLWAISILSERKKARDCRERTIPSLSFQKEEKKERGGEGREGGASTEVCWQL